MRAVETTGRAARARIDLPLLGRALEAEFGPSQIRTFRVPASGGDVVEVDLVEWERADLPGGELTAQVTGTQPPPGDAEPDPVTHPVLSGDGPAQRDASDAPTPAELLAPGQRRTGDGA